MEKICYKNKYFDADNTESTHLKNQNIIYIIDRFYHLKIDIKKEKISIIKDILFAHALDKKIFLNPKKYDVIYFINDHFVDENLYEIQAFFYLKNTKLYKRSNTLILDILLPLTLQNTTNLLVFFEDKIAFYHNQKILYYTDKIQDKEECIKYIKSLYGHDIVVKIFEKDDIISSGFLYQKHIDTLPNLSKKDTKILPKISYKSILYIAIILLLAYPIFLLSHNMILRYQIDNFPKDIYTYDKDILRLYNDLEKLKNNKFTDKMPILESTFKDMNKFDIKIANFNLQEKENAILVSLQVILENEQILQGLKAYKIQDIEPIQNGIKATINKEYKNDKK